MTSFCINMVIVLAFQFMPCLEGSVKKKLVYLFSSIGQETVGAKDTIKFINVE